MRTPFLKFAGVATAAFLLLLYLPAARAGFTPHGTFGMRVGERGIVKNVVPAGPAFRAGVRAGDRADLLAVPWSDRSAISSAQIPAGLAAEVSIAHAGGVPRTLHLVADALPAARPLDAWLQAGSYLVTAISLIVAAAMVVLRPGAMSWWLLLYAAGTIGATELNVMYAGLPGIIGGPFKLAVYALIGGASAYPILPFVVRFPYDRAEGKRRGAYRASVALTIAAALGFFAYYFFVLWGGEPDSFATVNLFANAPVPLAIAALFWSYFQADARERQRLKWAIFGMSFAFAAYAASSFTYEISASLSNAIDLLTVVMPLSLAYAVLRHLLLDFGFALNRAIVYSATTTSLVIIVTAIDRLSSWLLGQFHMALAFDALATIGLGFVMGRIHKVLEAIVDRVLFRKRSQSERHLRRIAGAMSYASTPHSVDDMLAREPAATLDLASSAVFRYERSVQRFVRTASVKWTDDHAWFIDVDDPMVLLILNEQAVIMLDDVRWKHAGVPHGAAAPVVAVPIRFRREVAGFALYSGHENGTTLDPEETALIAALADSAGIAHGLAEAGLAQRRVGELEAQVASLNEART